ncbi:hypothetical protein FRB95_003957 [Tulasnella sp. JGI-2019a]|nr:hypothetical protein FRB95_003957 [Tulasnella sp. JGI-2019a]
MESAMEPVSQPLPPHPMVLIILHIKQSQLRGTRTRRAPPQRPEREQLAEGPTMRRSPSFHLWPNVLPQPLAVALPIPSGSSASGYPQRAAEVTEFVPTSTGHVFATFDALDEDLAFGTATPVETLGQFVQRRVRFVGILNKEEGKSGGQDGG